MPTEWSGGDLMKARLEEYRVKLKQAVVAVFQYLAPKVEAYAKENARWTDETGNARQALHTMVAEVSNQAVILYLSQGMEYGKWLELRFGGRYAIVMETLQQHYNEVMELIRGIIE